MHTWSPSFNLQCFDVRNEKEAARTYYVTYLYVPAVIWFWFHIPKMNARMDEEKIKTIERREGKKERREMDIII